MKDEPPSDIAALRAALEREIASYVYTHDERCVGNPMPDAWVAAQLAEMRAALVDPQWREVEIRDSVDQALGRVAAERRRCVRVADDRNGHELYYDPMTRDFVLAYAGDPPTTFNIRGDAVGCFMAR